MNIRISAALLSAALASTQLCWASVASGKTPLGFYSPVELNDMKGDSRITVSDKGDHTEISFSLARGLFADRIVESRWEDGSSFYVIKSGRRIESFDNLVSPYWGYSTIHGLEIFFVDEPIPKTLGYTYVLTATRGGQVRSYDCTFDHGLLKTLGADRRARRLEAEGYDAVPYLISRSLSVTGVDFRRDKCRTRAKLDARARGPAASSAGALSREGH